MASPFITVLIPTFRRPDLLRRAVESVVGQTFTDWELVISDDEDPAGPTWDYLRTLADPRIRITRNPGPHGQCGNVSHGMRESAGQWIKFLYDDDVLRPECLAVFALAVRQHPDVACVSCGVIEMRDGKPTRTVIPQRPLLALFPQRYIHLGMYLQEDVGFGVPSQTMVSRRVIEKGVLFDPHPQLRSGVDSYFSIRVATLGDSLAIRAPLVEFHQGEHESITNTMGQEALDEEFRVLRRLQLPLIDPALRPPSLSTIYQMLHLIRATNRAARRRFGDALAQAVRCWRPAAWYYFARWLLRRRKPGQFSSVPKTHPDDSAIAQLLGVK